MESRRGEVLAGEFKPIERGWCLGGEEFRQELLEQVDTPSGPSHFGAAVQEGEQARAERLVRAGLKRLGWSEAELKSWRKGDQRKVALARELRGQTTMPLAWIAERLSMGSRGCLAWLLGSARKPKKSKRSSNDLFANMTISLTDPFTVYTFLTIDITIKLTDPFKIRPV